MAVARRSESASRRLARRRQTESLRSRPEGGAPHEAAEFARDDCEETLVGPVTSTRISEAAEFARDDCEETTLLAHHRVRKRAALSNPTGRRLLDVWLAKLLLAPLPPSQSMPETEDVPENRRRPREQEESQRTGGVSSTLPTADSRAGAE